MLDPVLLIALPLLTAFLVPLVRRAWRPLGEALPLLTLLFDLALAISYVPRALEKPIVVIIAGWRPPLGINLTIGPLGIFMAVMILFVAVLVAIYSIWYIRVEPKERYCMLCLMLVTGSLGMVLTGDIFNLFVFMEITSISAYALTAFIRDRDGSEAAFKYLIIGSLASNFFLLGVVLIYSSTGTLNMADLAAKMPSVDPRIAVPAVILMVVGLGVESEMFPLNGWAPDAYSMAPTPIGAVFGAIVVKGAVYALARMLYTIFNFQGVIHFLVIMGIVTLLMGEMAALRQRQIKRMLAFSSIGQMGLILVALGLGTAGGLVAALFHMLNHALLKALLFLTAGYLVYHSGSKEIADMDGMGRRVPLLAVAFSIGAFGIMGLPPLNGFWSKFLVISETVKAHYVAIAALALVGSVIEAVYYLRVVGRLFFKPADERVRAARLPVSAFVSLGLLVVAVVVIGLYPGWVMHVLQPAAHELLDKSFYIHSVLGP
ncbi:MAG: proton-conducting membrane transporter [Calditrichaeota bacterium]|nr:proton-conducting membrane transporter [Calditrichota bacterium]